MPSKTSCRKVYVLRQNTETMLQKTLPNQATSVAETANWVQGAAADQPLKPGAESWSFCYILEQPSGRTTGSSLIGANRVISAQQGQRPWAAAITPPSAQRNTAHFTQLRAQGEGSFATRQQVHFQTIHIKKKKKKKEQEPHLIKREHRKLENLQSYNSSWNQEFFFFFQIPKQKDQWKKYFVFHFNISFKALVGNWKNI